MALEGFESSIGGKWILLRNEKLDEYLSAMGMSLLLLIFFKMSRIARKPVIESSDQAVRHKPGSAATEDG